MTQEGFKGGGALAGSVLRAMWVMVSKRWCSFSSGEDGLMAYRLTLAALIQNAL